MLKRGFAILTAMILASGAFGAAGIAKTAPRVAIVFATGGLGDQSFNDSALQGVLRAREKYGIEYDYAEPRALTEYHTYLGRFAVSGRYHLIIAIGFDQADALGMVAERFKAQRFVIVDAVVDKPNIAAYTFKEAERGFLLGVAAGLMTARTGDHRINPQRVIGVIGGMKIPLIEANIAGYIQGAKHADPKVAVLHAYVGSWTDPAKGKELAISMFEQGADIVWGAAGRSGLGVIHAAKEKNRYAMGSDADQGFLAPDHILTNGMKYVDHTVEIAIERGVRGGFTGGIHRLGVREDALGYTESLLPPDILDELRKIKEKISTGEIRVLDAVAR